MGKAYITGTDFYNIFIHGAGEVIKNKEHLNRINVFPVADGDTGNNLVMTLKSVLDYAKVEDSFYETANSMANASLVGARGNSGVIFAQYILGLANFARGKEKLYVEDFIQANEASANGLYKVLSAPVEGTMLTVIKVWAKSLKQHRSQYHTYEEMFRDGFYFAVDALNHTPDQLEILKKNQVVDSGAKGFVLFLEGIRNYILGIKEENSWSYKVEQTEEMVAQAYSPENHLVSKYRYCCECIVNHQSPENIEENLHKLIDTYGDSGIVLNNNSLAHIHIHTNSPQLLFTSLSKYGRIDRAKIEDMKMQNALEQSLSNQKLPIGLVVDTIADISKELIEENQIHQLPINLNLGENGYLDKLGISQSYLFDYMTKHTDYPSSSIPSDAQIKEKLLYLSKYYQELIFVTVSSKMSGVHQSVTRVAKELEEAGVKITVIDSKLNSGAQGLLVLELARLIKENKSFEEIQEKAEDLIKNTKIYVALATFKNAEKSGRVPSVVGKIGTAFRLKPIISIDENGGGSAFSIALTQKSLKRKIVEIVEKEMKNQGIAKYSVVYTGEKHKAYEFSRELEKIIGKSPEYITETSSATALHVGEGVFALSYIK